MMFFKINELKFKVNAPTNNINQGRKFIPPSLNNVENGDIPDDVMSLYWKVLSGARISSAEPGVRGTIEDDKLWFMFTSNM